MKTLNTPDSEEKNNQKTSISIQVSLIKSKTNENLKSHYLTPLKQKVLNKEENAEEINIYLDSLESTEEARRTIKFINYLNNSKAFINLVKNIDREKLSIFIKNSELEYLALLINKCTNFPGLIELISSENSFRFSLLINECLPAKLIQYINAGIIPQFHICLSDRFCLIYKEVSSLINNLDPEKFIKHLQLNNIELIFHFIENLGISYLQILFKYIDSKDLYTFFNKLEKETVIELITRTKG